MYYHHADHVLNGRKDKFDGILFKETTALKV